MVRIHPGTAVPKRGKAKSEMLCMAFLEGAPWSVKPFSVYYGVDEHNLERWRREMADPDYDVYVIDNSYFDKTRGTHFRVTKNAMQVDPRGRVSDGKRFDTLGIEIKPWQHNPQGHYLIVEQSPAFMRDVARDRDWFTREVAELSSPDSREVRVRRWNPNKPKLAASLQDDLRGCWALITHSSAAAVEAALAGVTPLVEPMSAMAHMTSLALEERRRFMGVLAEHQFTLSELKNGYAWTIVNNAGAGS